MSVFTTVTATQLEAWLKNYAVGTLVELQGIAAGIENTNYFVTTMQGRYVLTLFEKLTAHELPFYLNLMAHLAAHGVPCPAPIANASGTYLGVLNDKPASLVTRLTGSDLANSTPADCAKVGTVLAQIHVCGSSYDGRMDNPRGPQWWLGNLWCWPDSRLWASRYTRSPFADGGGPPWRFARREERRPAHGVRDQAA